MSNEQRMSTPFEPKKMPDERKMSVPFEPKMSKKRKNFAFFEPIGNFLGKLFTYVLFIVCLLIVTVVAGLIICHFCNVQSITVNVPDMHIMHIEQRADSSTDKEVETGDGKEPSHNEVVAPTEVIWNAPVLAAKPNVEGSAIESKELPRNEGITAVGVPILTTNLNPRVVTIDGKELPRNEGIVPTAVQVSPQVPTANLTAEELLYDELCSAAQNGDYQKTMEILKDLRSAGKSPDFRNPRWDNKTPLDVALSTVFEKFGALYNNNNNSHRWARDELLTAVNTRSPKGLAGGVINVADIVDKDGQTERSYYAATIDILFNYGANLDDALRASKNFFNITIIK